MNHIGRRLQHTLARQRPTRARRVARGFGYTLLAGSAVYVYDANFNATAIGRNVRTLSTGLIIALDYKLNFNAANADAIPALQERVAERLYNLLTSNGGLYIKMGQAIGANAAILPPPFRERFGRLFDDAPQIPFEDVERVIKREFGVGSIDEVFDDFEEKAVASASIAQVHRARLKDRKRTLVAVKVQKPAVTKQVNWDLAAYKFLMWCYDKIFPMPIYFLADFIADHLRRELDFRREAQNAIDTATCLESTPYSSLKLSGRVYIPHIYKEYTTGHVMTAEWIDGVRMSDRDAVRRFVDGEMAINGSSLPIKGGVKAVMNTMVEFFCAQMFIFGFIHCDPHPGNILLRRSPSNPREHQLVVLDHGLYVHLTPKFQTQYATLWKSLLTLDVEKIKEIGKEWGIGNPDLFASATLMRPVRLEKRTNKNDGGDSEERKLSQYEIQEKMKEQLKNFLSDTDRMPKELVFIGRNMRIVQGNNQSFGSPVNRIRIMASYASRSLSYNIRPSGATETLVARIRASFDHLIFLSVLFSMDCAFYYSKFRQWLRGGRGGGWEEEIERGMRGFAKENLGVELEGAFEG